jgi:hypothetical protein
MRRIHRCALFLLLVSLSIGCAARHIREAQDEFSRAATVENAAFLRGYGTDASELTIDPAAGYRVSLALINLELAKNEDKLRADRLYGTALMLKAMCLWRLAGDSIEQARAALEHANDELANAPEDRARQKAVDDAKTMLKAATDGKELGDTILLAEQGHARGELVLGPRDLAMLKALPGLRDHEIGLAARDWETAQRFFESSVEFVGGVVDDPGIVPPGHPLAVYLRLAIVSTCRAWQSSAYAFSDSSSQAIERSGPALDEAEKRLGELAKMGPDESLGNAIELMKGRLGLN